MNLGDYPQRATGWLASLDEITLRKARSTQHEAIADAAIAVLGLFLLGWSPIAMLLFMVFSLWLRLFEQFAEWFIDGPRLERTLHETVEIDRARAVVRHLRDGAEETHSEGTSLHPALDRLGVQLALTFYFVGAYSIALIYLLIDTVGLSLISELLDRPDMLILMGGIVGLRIYSLIRRVRDTERRAPWLGTITPMLEILLFPMLVAFWMIFSAVGVRIAEMLRGDPLAVSASIFVCGGYALIVWRAAIELRDLPELTRDLSWLAERA